MAGTAASAATLDFTNVHVAPDSNGNGGVVAGPNGVYDTFNQAAGIATGMIGLTTWTLTSGFDPLNVITKPDAQLPLPSPGDSSLAMETDGVGVGSGGPRGDDEVTNDGERLTLSFNRGGVFLTGVHFLDLFFKDAGQEAAVVFNEGTSSEIATAFALDEINSGLDNGYAFLEINPQIAVTSVSFYTAGTNEAGTPVLDFALAGVDYASDPDGNPDPVPLPAGGLLLVGALAGLGLARRRKSAA